MAKHLTDSKVESHRLLRVRPSNTTNDTGTGMSVESIMMGVREVATTYSRSYGTARGTQMGVDMES